MKFELEETLRGASDEDFLDDLRRVAKLLGKETMTQSEYRHSGKASIGTIVRRFGSWNDGLERADLKVKVQRNISDDDLFENLEQMWVELGRQPRYLEVKFPFSRFANVTYDKRFGRFSQALEQFVVWVNSDRLDQSQESTDADSAAAGVTQPPSIKRRSRREVSDRQRFRILVRDGFRCKACGLSPLAQPGVELHVDHILPWSKGGETTDDNLESKCKQCNLGKGNAFDV
jgi:Homing endonuclease associated repeat/HNH endonuclease